MACFRTWHKYWFDHARVTVFCSELPISGPWPHYQAGFLHARREADIAFLVGPSTFNMRRDYYTHTHATRLLHTHWFGHVNSYRSIYKHLRKYIHPTDLCRVAIISNKQQPFSMLASQDNVYVHAHVRCVRRRSRLPRKALYINMECTRQYIYIYRACTHKHIYDDAQHVWSWNGKRGLQTYFWAHLYLLTELRIQQPSAPSWRKKCKGTKPYNFHAEDLEDSRRSF